MAKKKAWEKILPAVLDVLNDGVWWRSTRSMCERVRGKLRTRYSHFPPRLKTVSYQVHRGKAKISVASSKVEDLVSLMLRTL
jgi:hypothetical protein